MDADADFVYDQAYDDVSPADAATAGAEAVPGLGGLE